MTFLNKFFEYIREMLIDAIGEGLSELFSTINREIESVGASVSTTPADWNPDIYSMAKGISEAVILPIAGIILACVLLIEVLSLVNDKNNMHSGMEFNIGLIKSLLKMMAAVMVVDKAPTIIMGIFDVGNYIVTNAKDYISINATLDPAISAADVVFSLQESSLFKVITVLVSLYLVRFTLFIVSLIIQLVIITRMIEIYIYCSVAPIPMSLFAAKELNGIGINYLKGIAALALQSFLIMMCLGIYSVLIQGIPSSDNLGVMFFQLEICAIVLAISLYKSGQMAKSLFTAH